MKKICLIMGFISMLISPVSTWAWQPNGPIRIIIPTGAGGSTNELVMRKIDEIVQKKNPQVSFIFEWRPGLDSVVGMNYFGEQRPDGQTLFSHMYESSALVAPIAYRSQLQVNPENYVPVTLLAHTPAVLAVPSSSPVKNTKELIALLKNQNRRINIASNSTTNMLVYEYIVHQLGIDRERVQLINYKSMTEAAVAVASGQVDVGILTATAVKPFVGTRMKVLAHTGNTPIPGLESVPAINSFVPGLTLDKTLVIFLPPNTPKEIQQWYQEKYQEALDTTEARAFFYTNLLTPSKPGSEEIARYKQQLQHRWGSIANKVLKEK